VEGPYDETSFTRPPERIIARASEPGVQRLTLDWLLSELSERSLASQLLLLALPSLLLPPIAAAALGAPMLLVSLQMAVAAF
jgi:hypothetical protein